MQNYGAQSIAPRSQRAEPAPAPLHAAEPGAGGSSSRWPPRRGELEALAELVRRREAVRESLDEIDSAIRGAVQAIGDELDDPTVFVVGDQYVLAASSWPRCIATNVDGKRCRGAVFNDQPWPCDDGADFIHLEDDDHQRLLRQRCRRHADGSAVAYGPNESCVIPTSEEAAA